MIAGREAWRRSIGPGYSTVTTANGRLYTTSGSGLQVYDVSGAGDTVLTLVGLTMAAGAPLPQAIGLASHAAAVVVRKLGTATPTAEEIIDSVRRLRGDRDATPCAR